MRNSREEEGKEDETSKRDISIDHPKGSMRT